ncbi:MAG: hypothetical protein MUO77_05175 [Anaerolineales bacterium]|nr:hypothetical protein [Anaerolineales bacterium]
MSMNEGEEFNYDTAPPEESNNRTFLIAAGILGGIVLLSIACLAVYALVFLPGQKATSSAANDVQATTNAQIQGALTATMQAQLQPTATAIIPSPTSLLAPLPTATSQAFVTNTPDPVTATMAVALTKAMAAQLTVVVQPTASAIPGTGIADEYGLPGLVAMGLAFMIVILLARRLRSVPVSNK